MANDPRIDKVLDAALGDEGKYDENGEAIDYGALKDDPSLIDSLALPQDTKDAMKASAALHELGLNRKAVGGMIAAMSIAWASEIPTHEVDQESMLAIAWGSAPQDGTVSAASMVSRLYGSLVTSVLAFRSAVKSAQQYKQAADTALRAANLQRRPAEQVTQPSPN